MMINNAGLITKIDFTGHYVQEVRGLAKDDGPLDAQLVHHARGQEDAAHN